MNPLLIQDKTLKRRKTQYVFKKLNLFYAMKGPLFSNYIALEEALKCAFMRWW